MLPKCKQENQRYEMVQSFDTYRESYDSEKAMLLMLLDVAESSCMKFKKRAFSKKNIHILYDAFRQHLGLPVNKPKQLDDLDVYLEDYGYECYYCGKHLTKENGEMDHYWPQMFAKDALGADNIFIACHECNQRKGDDMPLLFERTCN